MNVSLSGNGRASRNLFEKRGNFHFLTKRIFMQCVNNRETDEWSKNKNTKKKQHGRLQNIMEIS